MKQGFWTGVTAALLATGLAGCVESETGEGAATARAIDFGVATESRTVVDEAADMRAFSVWGHYVSKAETLVEVFGEIGLDKENTGVTVSGAGGGGWSYEGARYWVEDVSYDFHAVYPVPLEGGLKHAVEYTVEDGSSALSIIGFDASSGTDLLYAGEKGLRYEATTRGSVPLRFYHLLARVEFVGKLDAVAAANGVTATVTAAKLHGMPKDGTFTSEGFDENDAAATITAGWKPLTNVSDSYATVTNEPLTTAEKSLFGDVFVFPGKVRQGYRFDVTYMVDGEQRTQEVDLSTLAQTTWEPGKVYRYTLTVTAEENLKLVVQVLDWENESASVGW